jgi:hypothetical protein
VLQAKERLVSSFKEIQHTLAELHDLFAGDGEEVQREWVKFTVKADKKVGDALRHTVKRSLQEMSRLLNGDSKTEVLPIFRCATIPNWNYKCHPQRRWQPFTVAVLHSCACVYVSRCLPARTEAGGCAAAKCDHMQVCCLQGDDDAGAQQPCGAAAHHPAAV